LDNFELETFW